MNQFFLGILDLFEVIIRDSYRNIQVFKFMLSTTLFGMLFQLEHGYSLYHETNLHVPSGVVSLIGQLRKMNWPIVKLYSVSVKTQF